MQLENEPQNAAIVGKTRPAHRGEAAALELHTRLSLLPRPDLASPPCDRRRSFATALSWAMAQIVEGFALCGDSMHPEVYWPANEPDHGASPRDWPLGWHESSRPQTLAYPPRRAGPSDWAGQPLPRYAIDHPVDLDEVMLVEIARRNPRGWRRFPSMLAKAWSAMCRGAEARRACAALAALDDRCLKDIGLSRHEIDYVVRRGRDRR